MTSATNRALTPWAVGFLLAIYAAPICGQVPDSLYPGLRIRVTQAVAPRQLAGSFQMMDSTFLRLVPEGTGEPLDVPLSEIRALYAGAGSRRPLARGAMWGALVGLALGTTLTLAFDGQCLDCVDSGGGAPLVIGFTTVIGAAFGLAVGSAIEVDRWEPVPPPFH